MFTPTHTAYLEWPPLVAFLIRISVSLSFRSISAGVVVVVAAAASTFLSRCEILTSSALIYLPAWSWRSFCLRLPTSHPEGQDTDFDYVYYVIT